MNIYAESSAILSWLLGEDADGDVMVALQHAEIVVASDLTLIECDRVIIRAVALEEMHETAAADSRARLNAAAAHWQVWRITPNIVDRARRSFPAEPLRTLDAIHLASALTARSALPSLEVLALDGRIRRAARQLGFALQPK
jgi:predicted nucleic acid-binding protein